jgi:hypothetical protein
MRKSDLAASNFLKELKGTYAATSDDVAADLAVFAELSDGELIELSVAAPPGYQRAIIQLMLLNREVRRAALAPLPVVAPKQCYWWIKPTALLLLLVVLSVVILEVRV